MKFIELSLTVVADAHKLSPNKSIAFKIDELLQLEDDRLQSSYISNVIQQRRKALMNRTFKVFKEDDLVLHYNSKLGPHLGELKLRYMVPFRIYSWVRIL